VNINKLQAAINELKFVRGGLDVTYRPLFDKIHTELTQICNELSQEQIKQSANLQKLKKYHEIEAI